MKLSEAIKIGADKVPHQIAGDFQAWNREGCLTGACAIGAACYVAAPEKRFESFGAARRLFPQLYDQLEVNIPEVGEYTGFLEDLIVYFNDEKKYPLDRIAELMQQMGY